MGERREGITKFQVSQGPSTEHDKVPEKVKVRFNVSKDSRNVGQPDPLRQSLTKPPPHLPTDEHSWSHSKTSHPRGALYTPMGKFGRPTTGSVGGSHATDFRSHTSRPGGNPLGSPRNHKGGNPLGNYSGKRGDNPLGRAMNRVGTNAVPGHERNAHGEKSGYPKFIPRGGGRNV